MEEGARHGQARYEGVPEEDPAAREGDEPEIDEFIENENAKFDKKHAKLLEENKELRKKRAKAGTQLHSAQMRMAVKHGFVRIRRSSYRRSRLIDVEDMME